MQGRTAVGTYELGALHGNHSDGLVTSRPVEILARFGAHKRLRKWRGKSNKARCRIGFVVADNGERLYIAVLFDADAGAERNCIARWRRGNLRGREAGSPVAQVPPKFGALFIA